MSKKKMERILQPYHIALYSIVVVTLFFLVDVFDPFNLPKLAALIVFAFSSLGCFLGNLRTNALKGFIRSGRSERVFIFGVVSFPLVLAVIGLMNTESVSHALWGNVGRNIGVLYYFSVSLLMIFVALGNFEGSQNTGLRVVYTVSVPFALYCLAQSFGLDPIPWKNPFDPMLGTLGNPNFSSGLLGALSGFYFFRLLTQGRKSRLIFLDAILFVLTVFLTIRNSSTQGRLLLIISALLFFYYWSHRKWPKRSLRFAFLTLTSLGAFITLYSFLGRGPLGKYLYQDTIAIRYEYWSVAVKSLIHHPWFGVGIDSYIEGFRLYRSSEFANERSLAVVSDNAHNILLQVGATSGFLSMTLLIVIMGVILKKALGCLTRVTQDSRIQIPFAVLWILLFIQSQVSIEQIGLGIWIWVLGGAIMNRTFMNVSTVNGTSAQQNRNSYNRNFGRELAFIFGVLALLFVVPRVQEDSRFGRLLIMPIDGNTNPSSIDQVVEKFTSFTFEEPKRVIGVANAYFLANWNQKGEEYLENLRKMDDQNWESRDALALAYGSLNQFEKAIVVREEMTKLDPNHWINFYELANLYVKVQDFQKALINYQNVVRIAPNSIEGKKSLEWIKGNR